MMFPTMLSGGTQSGNAIEAKPLTQALRHQLADRCLSDPAGGAGDENQVTVRC